MRPAPTGVVCGSPQLPHRFPTRSGDWRVLTACHRLHQLSRCVPLSQTDVVTCPSCLRGLVNESLARLKSNKAPDRQKMRWPGEPPDWRLLPPPGQDPEHCWWQLFTWCETGPWSEREQVRAVYSQGPEERCPGDRVRGWALGGRGSARSTCTGARW